MLRIPKEIHMIFKVFMRIPKEFLTICKEISGNPKEILSFVIGILKILFKATCKNPYDFLRNP